MAGVLIGPAIGGLLVGFLGTAWGFGIDAASFIISAAAVYAMRGRSAPVPSGESPLADLREGLRFCVSQRWLWATTLGASLGNFVAFSPLGTMIPLLVKHVLHGGGVALGLVLAAGGLGGLAATVLAGRREPPQSRLVHLWIGWGLSGIGVLGLGFVPDVWLAGGVAFVTYGLDAYGSVMFNPLIRKVSPPRCWDGCRRLTTYSDSRSAPSVSWPPAPRQTQSGSDPPSSREAPSLLTTLIPLLPGVEDPTLRHPGTPTPKPSATGG